MAVYLFILEGNFLVGVKSSKSADITIVVIYQAYMSSRFVCFFCSPSPRHTGIAKHFRYGSQEDAHEFLRYTVDAMQKSCLPGTK